MAVCVGCRDLCAISLEFFPAAWETDDFTIPWFSLSIPDPSDVTACVWEQSILPPRRIARSDQGAEEGEVQNCWWAADVDDDGLQTFSWQNQQL